MLQNLSCFVCFFSSFVAASDEKRNLYEQIYDPRNICFFLSWMFNCIRYKYRRNKHKHKHIFKYTFQQDLFKNHYLKTKLNCWADHCYMILASRAKPISQHQVHTCWADLYYFWAKFKAHQFRCWLFSNIRIVVDPLLKGLVYD